MNSQIDYKKWASPTQSHHTSELAVLIPLIPFSQSEGNRSYILDALSKPLTYMKITLVFLVKGNDNPQTYEHHNAGCFVPVSLPKYLVFRDPLNSN